MTQILDARGRLITREALAETQSSRLGWITREWADHPSRGITPQRLARIMEEAEQGNLIAQSDLFMDMEEKDGHIMSEMSKRKRAILTLPWEIHEPKNATPAEKRETAMIREWFNELPAFDDFLLDCLDAVGHAFVGIELEWQQIGAVKLPSKMTHRPQRWFQTLMHDGNALRLRNGSAEGEELWPLGWIVHEHKARSGYIARGGLHRSLAWPYLFKNYATRDLAEFLEIYGLPLRLGKYPAGTTDRDRATLLAAVVGIGHNAAGIIPDGMDIDFKNAADGTQDPFEFMIGWCERTQSKIILGGTLTSQADGKSSTNALGKVHDDVRHDLLASDARQLAATITRQVIGHMRAVNVPGADPRRSPEFRFDTRHAEDLKVFAAALPELVGVGMQIPADWAHERLNIPKPERGQAVLSVVTAGGQPPGTTDLPAARAALAATAPASTRQPMPASQAARLAADVAPMMDDWIDKIRDLVERASTLDEIRDGLLALAPDMSLDEFADAMAEALTAASLAGRADILGEAGG